MFAFWKYGNNKVHPPPQRFRALKWLEEKAASRSLSAHVWRRTHCVHFFFNLLLKEIISALAPADPPPSAPPGAGARSAGCRPSQRPAGGGTAPRGRRLGETSGGGKGVVVCVRVCVCAMPLPPAAPGGGAGRTFLWHPRAQYGMRIRKLGTFKYRAGFPAPVFRLDWVGRDGVAESSNSWGGRGGNGGRGEARERASQIRSPL